MRMCLYICLSLFFISCSKDTIKKDFDINLSSNDSIVEGNHGYVTFFTVQNYNTKLFISINNNLVGKIEGYYSNGKPNCGIQNPGVVSLMLNHGSYNFSAKDTLNNIIRSGSFVIENYKCNLIEIK